jgi:hypothetical protein
MQIDSIRKQIGPHIDHEFNKGFTEKFLKKIEFGTQASAIFEKATAPRYLMIKISKKGEKFYSPISLHQSSDILIRKIENIFKEMKDLGYIRFKGK